MRFPKAVTGDNKELLIGIYKTFGKKVFFVRDVKLAGIEVKNDKIFRTFGYLGILHRCGRDNRTAMQWCLSEEAYNHIRDILAEDSSSPSPVEA